MNNIMACCVAAMPVLLSGCLTGLSGPIDVNGLADAATDRHAAWAQVESRKLEAVGKIADAEKARAEAKIHSRAAQPQMTITDAQSMALYQLGEANRRLSEALDTVAGVAMSAVSGGRWSVYTAGITFVPQPQGAFAEFMQATLGGVADVFDTPTAGIVAGGLALDKVMNGRPPSNQFNGDVNADNAFNASTLHQTGSTGNPSLAPSVVRPEVVRPEVVMPAPGGE